ncbi:MAG: phosphocholine cytidylyltransferase family protein [Deltaproteobacteria bacterium]|nr:phosphocholine cytidylyltransferase family protein [Deltaproteobacteria bacterium]
MKALILAGGQGDRLNHLTQNQPKVLVNVAGRALISYTLEFLQNSRIAEIGVVVGYQAPLCIDFLKKHYPSVRIFQTPHFDKGSLLGMQCTLSILDDDFLLCNADHIYPKHLLDVLLKQSKGITAACDFDRPLVADDMKIKRGRQGTIQAIHKTLKDYDGGYIGMTYCPASKLSTYLSARETALAKLGPKASVEMILGDLAARGEPITIADTSGIRWLEIDTPEDLEKAEQAIRNLQKDGSLSGRPRRPR